MSAEVESVQRHIRFTGILREASDVAKNQQIRELEAELAELKAEVEKLNTELEDAVDSELYLATVNSNLRKDAELAELKAENEQLHVQLAGCLTAAEGCLIDAAKKGDYGWSFPYQRILELQAQVAALREAVQMLVEQKIDYMKRNHLGNPYNQPTVKLALAALASSTDKKGQ